MHTQETDVISGPTSEGVFPECRIRNAEHLLAIHRKYLQDDEKAAFFRSRCQLAINGEPPFSQDKLKSMGLDGVSNNNFGEAEGFLEAAVTPYMEIITGVPRVADVKCTYGDETEQHEFSQIISEEYDWMFKKWDEAHLNVDLLAKYFVGDGVAVTAWPDDVSVFWEPIPIGQFLTDRNTKPSEEAMDCVTISRRVRVGQLYKYIKDEQYASGWDVDAVKKAIWKASKNPSRWKSQTMHWEDFVESIKENDIYLGNEEYNTVELIMGLVREFDGSVTKVIGAEDCDTFLFKRRGIYEKMNQAFTLYTYGVGSGKIHTIRGLKHKIFKLVQASNIMLNRGLDGAILSSSIPMQGTSEALQKLKVLNIGPWTLVPEGINPIQNYMVPNVGQNILPMHGQMMRTLNNVTGTYQLSGGSVDQPNIPRSAAEVRMESSNKATLSVASFNQFYVRWSKTHRETLRRALSPRLRQFDDGGRLAFEFRMRCIKRGVPAAALDWKHIESVDAVRSIGNGSPAMRNLAMQELRTMIGSFDEVGRSAAILDIVAAIQGIGYSQARRYMPNIQPRMGFDEQIANIENNQLRQGLPAVVTGEQNHFVHAIGHLRLIAEVMDALSQQAMENEAALPILRPAVDHTIEHSMILSQDNTRVEDANEVRRQLQNVSAFVNQMEQQLVAKMEKEQRRMQAEGGDDPAAAFEMQKQQMEIQKEQIRIQAQRERHQQQMQMMKAKMEQADMEAARNAALDAVEARRTVDREQRR